MFQTVISFSQEQGGIYITGETIFQSLSELVAYYRKYELSARTKLKLAKHYGHIELWGWSAVAVASFYTGKGQTTFGTKLFSFLRQGKCHYYSSRIMFWQSSLCPVTKWGSCFHEAKKGVLDMKCHNVLKYEIDSFTLHCILKSTYLLELLDFRSKRPTVFVFFLIIILDKIYVSDFLKTETYIETIMQ